MTDILQRYARLLTHYCLEVRPGDKVFISATTLAEPLLREAYRAMLEAGAAVVDYDLGFRERDLLLLTQGSDEALRTPPTLHKMAMETYDRYLHIRAPFNLREMQNVPGDRAAIRQEAMSPLNKAYSARIARKAMARCLCQYPTDAAAQEAGMSLSEYQDFVFGACKLFHEDPAAEWRKVRANQQSIVDHLNKCSTMRYISKDTDISFSTKDRIWINSDGRANMPSGEVFTGPVEDSVNGTIFFSYPGVYMGHEVENVRLWVKDGLVERWEATRGKDFLNYIFTIPGARRFGEAAIGTNYDISRITKNILFDEKIGGSIHMAIGQSYLHTGGNNESSVHWDMITDMTEAGEIWADGEKIYEKGKFLI
jgi:aminopeptidase